MFEWDPEKHRRNIETRGIGFDAAERLDFTTAQVFGDDRVDYGEDRQIVRGMIDGRLHVVVFVLREGRIRIISLRKANRRERRAYAAETGRQIGDA